MDNLLLVYSSPLFYAISFIDYLVPHFDKIRIMPAYTDEEIKGFDIGINIEEYKNKYLLSRNNFTLKDALSFDVIMGIDNGCIPFLCDLKKNISVIKIGCQILDYPEHCLRKNSKDYREVAEKIWDYVSPHLHELDFYLCNYPNIEKNLKKKYFPNVPSLVQTYPAKTMIIENFENLDYIIYAGRLEKDKNISHIIEAVSLMENKIKLILITSGSRNFDYLPLCNDLNVNVKILKNISDKEKYDLYSKAMCGISLASPFCPNLCVKEMMSIGKNSVVYDWPEYREIFGSSLAYVSPYNLLDVSRKLDDFYKQCKVGNQSKPDINLINYYNKFLSYESWVKSFLKLLGKE